MQSFSLFIFTLHLKNKCTVIKLRFNISLRQNKLSKFSAGTRRSVRFKEKLNGAQTFSEHSGWGQSLTFQQDSDPKLSVPRLLSGSGTTLWMSLSDPAWATTWTQSNTSAETRKCPSANVAHPIWQSLRGSAGEEWQDIPKYRCA